MLLEGKRLLVTGVPDPRSIAFHVARLAQQEGAELVLTSHGRARRLTERTAGRLPDPPDVLELDVTRPQDIGTVANDVDARWGGLDGLVHAVAFAPESCLGGRGSVVGLDFDASVAWPGYDWMGVAKAVLEATARYLARDLGPDRIRVYLVAAGPLRTVAARSIEGFEAFEDAWARRAPLGWDVSDPEPVARVVCWLPSDWSTAVTGEIVHADGGAHAVGAARAGEAVAAPDEAPISGEVRVGDDRTT